MKAEAKDGGLGATREGGGDAMNEDEGEAADDSRDIGLASSKTTAVTDFKGRVSAWGWYSLGVTNSCISSTA